MDLKKIAENLPTVPRDGMREFIEDNWIDRELGGQYCIFYRTSVFVEDYPINMLMGADDYKAYYELNKYHHAAECKCTACGEKFITGWEKNHPSRRYGILMFIGEDGAFYDGYIPEDEKESSDFCSFREGEHIYCPYCDERLELAHKSRLREGRTFQLLITSVEVVDGYTVVMTWLARRTMNECGFFPLQIFPREALVINGRNFHRFTHVGFAVFRTGEHQLKEWEKREYRGEDITFRKYYDRSSNNSRKAGLVIWTNVPDLTGTTGEKTGLFDYIVSNNNEMGCYPLAYLKLWRKYPNVENLIKSKWRSIVDSEIYTFVNEKNYNYDMRYTPKSYAIDYSEKKPHKMLGIKKEDMQTEYLWTWQMLNAYVDQIDYIKYISVMDFDFILSCLGVDDVSLCIERTLDGYEHFEIEQVFNYILKQEEKTGIDISDGVVLLDDYRDLLYRTSIGRGIAKDEWWPKNLQEAHDRLVETQKILENENNKKQFIEIAEQLKAVEYTDGKFCIRVAATEQELIDEGKTLHHCVGGYGNKHIKRTDVIFFVRRYRRPERSYFTLDINLNGDLPKKVQLHGYRNEIGGQLKIPEGVQKFCDKWQKTILEPWFKAQKVAEKKNSKNKKEEAA